MQRTTTDTDRERAGRSAGVMLLAGATLLLAGNVAHPVDAAPSATSRFALATGVGWSAVHLALGIGMLLIALATVQLVTATHRDDRSWVASTAAVSAILGGGALSLVFTALDGFGVATLAERWTATAEADRGALEGAAIAMEVVDSGMAGFGTLLLFGVAMLALSMALPTGSVHRWLRPALSIVGVLGAVTGVALLTVGPSDVTINVMMRPLGGLATVTWAGLGISLVRRARSGRTASTDVSDAPTSATVPQR